MKNEGKMLPGLFESVEGQSKRPALWLIADDASTDDSFEQAKAFASKNPWVVVVTRGEVANPPWVRFGSAVSFGYEKALEAAKERGLGLRRSSRSWTRTRPLRRITSRSS